MQAQFYTLELFVSGPYSTKSYRSREPPREKEKLNHMHKHTYTIFAREFKKKHTVGYVLEEEIL